MCHQEIEADLTTICVSNVRIVDKLADFVDE